MNDIIFAFSLTLFAGLSTGIGSAIAFFSGKPSKRFLASSLGFSAGVMIYVAMIEIFYKGLYSLYGFYGERDGWLVSMLGFFGGIALMMLLNKCLPQAMPEEKLATACNHNKCSNLSKKKLLRTGLFTALAIGIHNFPEGLATFVSALYSPEVAIPLVVAIALHNIPEGIAVSVPIYYATGSKKKAFFYSFASGLAEPVGAIIGYSLLMPFINDLVYGLLFTSVAGIMVYISIEELLPSAEACGEHKVTINWCVLGMLIMAVSIWLFK